MEKKKVLQAICFTVFFFFVSFISLAQDGEEGERISADTTSAIVEYLPEGVWDLFGREGIIELTLKFNMRTYFRNANLKNPVYQKAKMIIHMPDTNIEKNVRIKSRGMFRRGYCDFPPMKLKVKKTGAENEDPDEKISFKVVTQCKHPYVYEKYLLREFLVYKMYNQLTDLSFRVRLLKMRYVDMPDPDRKPRKTLEKYGFIIEPTESMVQRNGMVELKLDHLLQKLMEPQQMALVAMFEYMIGNTDWSVSHRHNIKILKSYKFDDPNPYPVPYDFDYSGMVNTGYAIPRAGLNITSVTERHYLGLCLPEKYLNNTRALFLKKKEVLFRIIAEFTYLDKVEKKRMTKYLKGFFDILESDSSFKYNIQRKCKTVK